MFKLGDDIDGRDYPAMVEAIQAAISQRFHAAGDEHRQGFLRSKADVFCTVADGCVPSQEFDPLRTTAGAFLRAKSPPLETVLVQLTKAVERDLEQRGALPELRRAKAESVRGAASLHHLTPDDAGAVLDDAEARTQEVRGALLVAYNCHAKNIMAAIEEAERRPAAFAAAGPTSICKEGVPSERWRGTKAKLATLGIRLHGPWPHEPAGATRWASARDARGWSVRVSRPSEIWPDLFEVCITIPFESIRTTANDDILGDIARRRSLGGTKRTPDHIRSELRLVWSFDRPAIGHWTNELLEGPKQ